MKSYLGVTGHFIIDFKLHSIMLTCHRFRGSHTGEAIHSEFEAVLDSFDISGKVDNVVTDNASNMKRAFRLITAESDEEESGISDDEDEDEELVPVEDLELGMLPGVPPLFVTHYTAGGQRWAKPS